MDVNARLVAALNAASAGRRVECAVQVANAFTAQTP